MGPQQTNTPGIRQKSVQNTLQVKVNATLGEGLGDEETSFGQG